MMRRPFLRGMTVAGALLACLAPCARLAGAEPSEDHKATAAALFEQARRLMNEGSFDEACPKFAESQRLDPGGGTLLNLAVCHERIGRTATAWAEFRDALVQARRDGRDDRIQLAEERIAALAPRLSRLTVVVPRESRVIDLQLSRNGERLAEAGWGVALPVDPRAQVIDAQAPGKRRWTTTIQLLDDADSRRVVVPPLAAAPVPGALPPKAAEATKSRGQASAPSSVSTTIAYATGAVTLVGLAVGSAFGFRAITKDAQSDEACPSADQCTQAGADASHDAGLSADVSTATLAVAGGMAIATVLLLAFKPFDDELPVDVAPVAHPEVAGLYLRACF